MRMKRQFARWQANFFTGLAIVLPAVVSIALVIWLFGTVSNITNILLFPLKYFLAKDQIYRPDGKIFWYWSMVALLLSILLITIVGRSARHYIGRKTIQLLDLILLRVPLLNKIYGAIKQVNDAFASNNKSSFKQVVLVQFPRQGLYSLGFITGEQHQEVQAKTSEKVVSVFIPTTPNPTSGYLVLMPERDVIRLQMSVADGIKFIISLGSVAPPYVPKVDGKPVPVVAPAPAPAPSPLPTEVLENQNP